MAHPARPPAPINRPTKKQAPALGATAPPKKVSPKPVSRVFQERAARRLARLRSHDAKSLPGVNPSGGKFSKGQREAILGAIRNLNTQKKAPPKAPPAAPYDPLQPLTGKGFTDQVAADEKLQFGDQDTAVANQYTTQGRNEALTTSAYDQYRQALADATKRINDSANTNAAASQAQVDNAYNQDKASTTARDAATTTEAAKQGLAVGPSTTGAQVLSSGRDQGNKAVTAERTQNQATNDLMEKRTATSVLQKAEAQGGQAAKRAALDAQAKTLAGQHGAFKVSDTGKLRDSERTYALARKEFGLKVKSTNADINYKKGLVSSDKQKAAAQVIVAKLYAAADITKAKDQIKIAKIQLQKGRIDRHQYRTIVNIYKGLPKKGKAPQAKTAPAVPGGGAGGSGAGGSFAPWEQTKIDTGVSQMEDHKFGLGDKPKVVSQLIRKGYSQALADATWAKYVKKNHLDNAAPYSNRPRG